MTLFLASIFLRWLAALWTWLLVRGDRHAVTVKTVTCRHRRSAQSRRFVSRARAVASGRVSTVIVRCDRVLFVTHAGRKRTNVKRLITFYFDRVSYVSLRRRTRQNRCSTMASLRQTPLTCSGHTRPVVHLGFSDVTDSGYYLISACKGEFNAISKSGIRERSRGRLYPRDFSSLPFWLFDRTFDSRSPWPNSFRMPKAPATSRLDYVCSWQNVRSLPVLFAWSTRRQLAWYIPTCFANKRKTLQRDYLAK